MNNIISAPPAAQAMRTGGAGIMSGMTDYRLRLRTLRAADDDEDDDLGCFVFLTFAGRAVLVVSDDARLRVDRTPERFSV